MTQAGMTPVLASRSTCVGVLFPAKGRAHTGERSVTVAYAKAPHHRGAHQITARRVVAAANAQPAYTCPSCGLTLTEGIQRWGKNGPWDGGHRVHGRPEYGYHAQHAHCNRSEGASWANARRNEPQGERW